MINWHSITGEFHVEMTSVAGPAAVRLLVAGFLGGLIGLNREYRHRPAGLRTNMFICIGACLFTVLSGALSKGEDTRIAAQIITGIGFIGAGSILHARKEFITGLTSAATIFVVAGIGMAVGGGFYLTGTFATFIALAALFLLGRMERNLNLKLMICTYEVSGPSSDDLVAEVNRVLEPEHAMMRNVQFAPAKTHVRVQFELEGTHRRQLKFLKLMKQDPSLGNVVSLGPVEQE